MGDVNGECRAHGHLAAVHMSLVILLFNFILCQL